MTATVVLTVPDASVHQPGLIERALVAIGLTGGEAERFDLLTVGKIGELIDVDNPDCAALVAEDVRRIAERAHATRFVIAVYGDPSPYVARFREGSGWYRGVRFKTHGVNLHRFAESAPMTRLLVTDADRRLHGKGNGLIARVTHACGAGSYGVLAVGEPFAELAENTLRQSMAVAGIKSLARDGSLKELIVAPHYDRDGARDPIEALASSSSVAVRVSAALAKATGLKATPLVATVSDGRLLRFRAPV